MNGRSVGSGQINTLMSFFAVFVLGCLFTTALLIAFGVDHTNALMISLSCISNIGPSLDTQIGLEMTWTQLPDLIKWLCTLLMLIGRLEIFTVLLLFSRTFWKDN